MNDNEKAILKSLQKEFEKAEQVAEKAKIPLATIMSLSAELEANRLLQSKKTVRETIALSQEGRNYLEKGLPETRLQNAAMEKIPLKEAIVKAGLDENEGKIALQWAIKKQLINVEKQGTEILISKLDNKGEDDELLRQVAESQFNDDVQKVKYLEQRKLVEKKVAKEILLRITNEGEAALKDSKKQITQITPQILKSKDWKNAEIKPYDLQTVVSGITIGKRHFYNELLDEMKEALAGLGFQEEHGELVELSFWDLDVLLMPQDHPAREMHDLFFTKYSGKVQQPELVERVKKAHQQLWNGTWKQDLAEKVILRSQMTALSPRLLYNLKQTPARKFMIGKVFRPDEIDWKHFIEFNQCEGIVADEKMTFRELLGYLKVFAINICGAEDVKFVPSYFPFTEPSVELFAKINNKWAEIGGAGMFRPEMLEALGIKVPVLAWGLGIDRLALIRLGIKDLRDLHSQDLELIMKT